MDMQNQWGISRVYSRSGLLVRKENGGREAVTSTLDLMVKQKGAWTAFTKLVSEEAWEKRIKCMRVPDWVYLPYKLKSRTPGSGRQNQTNKFYLTKLGRPGVSTAFFIVLKFCPLFFFLQSSQ